MSAHLRTAAALAMGALLLATPARPETQTETIVAEQRLTVSVRIATAAAQAFLPAGWTPNTPNLSIIFMDRKLSLGPDGRPLAAGVNRLMVLAMSGRNAAGEVRSLIVGGISADPAGAPGAYKVYSPGSVTYVRTERADAQGRLESTVEERWTARGADGTSVELDLAFTRGVPTLSTFESRNYSGAEPSFYRIYRGEQASEVLRNASGVNKVQSVRLRVTGGKLGAAVNGSEEIVSISSAPAYSRRTFVE